jgi:hypothetical protein
MIVLFGNITSVVAVMHQYEISLWKYRHGPARA